MITLHRKDCVFTSANYGRGVRRSCSLLERVVSLVDVSGNERSSCATLTRAETGPAEQAVFLKVQAWFQVSPSPTPVSELGNQGWNSPV